MPLEVGYVHGSDFHDMGNLAALMRDFGIHGAVVGFNNGHCLVVSDKKLTKEQAIASAEGYMRREVGETASHSNGIVEAY
jgi:hypothetical protein